MNNWIHTAVRKPTKDDGNENGVVLARGEQGGVSTRHFGSVDKDCGRYVAWMPIPKYDPLPPVPEGYELLMDYNAEPDERALLRCVGMWKLRDLPGPYNKKDFYCVPSKPE